MKTRIVLFGSILALMSATAVAQAAPSNVGKTMAGKTMGGTRMTKPGKTPGMPGKPLGRGTMMKPTPSPQVVALTFASNGPSMRAAVNAFFTSA